MDRRTAPKFPSAPHIHDMPAPPYARARSTDALARAATALSEAGYVTFSRPLNEPGFMLTGPYTHGEQLPRNPHTYSHEFAARRADGKGPVMEVRWYVEWPYDSGRYLVSFSANGAFSRNDDEEDLAGVDPLPEAARVVLDGDYVQNCSAILSNEPFGLLNRRSWDRQLATLRWLERNKSRFGDMRR